MRAADDFAEIGKRRAELAKQREDNKCTCLYEHGILVAASENCPVHPVTVDDISEAAIYLSSDLPVPPERFEPGKIVVMDPIPLRRILGEAACGFPTHRSDWSEIRRCILEEEGCRLTGKRDG